MITIVAWHSFNGLCDTSSPTVYNESLLSRATVAERGVQGWRSNALSTWENITLYVIVLAKNSKYLLSPNTQLFLAILAIWNTTTWFLCCSWCQLCDHVTNLWVYQRQLCSGILKFERWPLHTTLMDAEATFVLAFWNACQICTWTCAVSLVVSLSSFCMLLSWTWIALLALQY